MKYADNGFGELVPVNSPFGITTRVYMRLGGKLAQFEASTPSHVDAIDAVRRANNDHRLNRYGRWRDGPVLAVIGRAA